MNTKEEILSKTITILAHEGYVGTSMRKIALAISREPSIIYAHFSDKETLLREVRSHINQTLDEAQSYTAGASASQLLRETIRFQFEYREMIVALLQYFMAARELFVYTDGGYIPERAYEHMARVIRQGIAESVYMSDDINFDAKLTTHLVNGFLMEYFAHDITEKNMSVLVEKVAVFIERSLSPQHQAALC